MVNSHTDDRHSRSGARAPRRVGGRREGDRQLVTTVSRKALVVIVALINFAFYLIQNLGDRCDPFP
jgi:hypothetical protein